MIEAELYYNSVKQEYLSLVFTIQKMRHFLWANSFMSSSESIFCDCS